MKDVRAQDLSQQWYPDWNGAMIIVLGFFGWSVDNYLFDTLSRILAVCGIDINRHFIFNDLGRLKQAHVSLILIGLVSLCVGVLILRKPLGPKK